MKNPTIEHSFVKRDKECGGGSTPNFSAIPPQSFPASVSPQEAAPALRRMRCRKHCRPISPSMIRLSLKAGAGQAKGS